MNSIAAIVSDIQEVGIRRAAHDAVEIDDGIKGAAPAHPITSGMPTDVKARAD